MSSTRVTVVAAVAVTLPSLWLIKRAIRRWIEFTSTAMDELPALGTSPPTNRKKHGTVVICGGSLTGLMCARVCSDHFERIIVVEPETWSLSPEACIESGVTGLREISKDGVMYNCMAHKRSRVFQHTFGHAYQAFVLLALRKLFRNFDERALARGAKIGPAHTNTYIDGHRITEPAGYGDKGEFLPETLVATRRTYEALLRSLVHEHCPQVEYVNGTVTELDTHNISVTGVNVRLVGDNGAMVKYQCDLVIDATGIAQAGLKLLSRTFTPYSKSAKLVNIREEYDPQVNYVTIEIEPPSTFRANLARIQKQHAIPGPDLDKRIYLEGYNPTGSYDNHGIWTAWVDGNRLNFIAGGWDSWMPLNIDQLRTYAEELEVRVSRPLPKWWWDVMDLLEPVKDTSTCVEGKIRSCSRVRYNTVPGMLPHNFIALGDSVMRLNPRGGQGVIKLTIGAATLDGILRRMPEGPRSPSFSRKFFQLLADRTDGIWELTRDLDYGWHTTKPCKGHTLETGSFYRWYFSGLAYLASYDRYAGKVFFAAGHCIGPSFDLFAPSILLKVVWNALVGRK
ncbi:hypothetical protein BKA62DRAFT_615198 [Auriculariales sp. MPI-PUGE-AT-0066]|nr:hypothetical protein BKA62DRAFT_615198 [Auriculariales sp. MPI-PUGE-AT-0066]